MMFDSVGMLFFFFKQKTAYEMRSSDWSSDVCSSDLAAVGQEDARHRMQGLARPRQVLGNHRVPEEQLQQQRNVAHHLDIDHGQQIGRASCRERVCQYV